MECQLQSERPQLGSPLRQAVQPWVWSLLQPELAKQAPEAVRQHQQLLLLPG